MQWHKLKNPQLRFRFGCFIQSMSLPLTSRRAFLLFLPSTLTHPYAEPRAVLVAAFEAQPFLVHLQQLYQEQQQQQDQNGGSLLQHLKAVLVVQEGVRTLAQQVITLGVRFVRGVETRNG